jgi:magnesium chelatase family protein
MPLSIVHSRTQVCIEAPAVTIEVHLANGLPSLTMVGRPDAALSKRVNKFLTSH